MEALLLAYVQPYPCRFFRREREKEASCIALFEHALYSTVVDVMFRDAGCQGGRQRGRERLVFLTESRIPASSVSRLDCKHDMSIVFSE